MSARKPLLFIGTAIVLAFAISYSWTPSSYEDQLIRIQAEQELGPIDKNILNETLEVQAQLLDHVGDKELVLKAWVSLSKYPDMARTIVLQYGSEPDFKEILKSYGDPVIPVIHYFRENNVWPVVVEDFGKRAIDAVTEITRSIWNRVTGKTPSTTNTDVQTKPRELGPNERGRLAVGVLKAEGHDLLGQFVVAPDKTVKWNQTDRMSKAITSILASGVRNFETKYDIGDLTKSDWFWAGVDVAVVAAPFKLLKAGKLVAPSGKMAAGTGKELSLAVGTRLFAPRMLAGSKVFQTLGTYGASLATAYIVVSYPSLVSGLLYDVASLFGLNPWLVQFVGWFLILWVVLYPFSWLLKALARLALLAFSWIEQSRMKSRAVA